MSLRKLGVLAMKTTLVQRHRRVSLMIMLLLILLLIITASLLGERLLSGTSATTMALADSGPFIQLPLNAQQIDDLRHLSGYMKDKQLASLYVARMSLDEEVGQLIMVEYNDTYYSPDLNEMITQLHAGGVIMYAFQMQSF